MRRLSAWLVMVTFLLALAAPALAQQAPAASTAPATKAPAPAKAEVKKMATKTAAGTVKTASADSLVLVKDKKEWTFALDKDTKITKGGKAAKVEEVAADDSATVTYVEQDGKMQAKMVAVKAKAAAAKPKS